jgi:hypothetical protein
MRNIAASIGSAAAVAVFMANAAAADQIDFRNCRWGMGKAEVKSAETAELIKEFDQRLVYQDTLAGEKVAVHHYFLENALFLSVLVFVTQQKKLNESIDSYYRVMEEIIDQYGEPTQSEISVKNDAAKDGPSQIAAADVESGATLFSQWQTARTDIVLQLTGDRYEIQHTLTYSPKQLTAIPPAGAGRQTGDNG